MADIDVRQWVKDRLVPLLPRTWRFVAFNTVFDRLTVPTVMLTLQSIERLPAAPMTSRRVAFLMTIIEPITDPERREDSIDNNVMELLNAIDDADDITWQSAQKVLANKESNLGYDITIEIIVNKEEA